MSSKIRIRNGLIFGLLFLSMILTACGGGQPTQAACGADTLQAAANLSPSSVIVDPSKPVTLSWTYADPACQPTYYEVALGFSHDGSAPGTTQVSQTTALNWPETLQPGNTYFWTVYPVVVTNGQATRGPGQLSVFFTGPTCAAGTALASPQTITPPNETPYDPDAAFTLRWDDPTTCLPDGSYNVQVAKVADFSTVLAANQTGHITEWRLAPGWTTDVVQDCTRYYWRVRSEGAGGPGPWSGTGTFLLNKVGGACSLLEASPTPIPQVIASATALPQTPLAAPAWLQANENTNCRRGPSPEYPILDTLKKQWSARIYGRNADSTWWYINSPNIAVGYYCWVWGGAVTVTGDTGALPVVTPPPPPTSTPGPTSTPIQ